MKILGLSEECSVCCVNKVEIYLPMCGHACMCSGCLDVLKQKDDLPPEEPVKIFDYQIDIMKEEELSPLTIESALEKIKDNDTRCYVIIATGQGCQIFVRRDGRYGPLEGFFMHGDNWGQYNKDTDHRPFMDAFIKYYGFIE